MTRIVEVPTSFDDRSFDHFAQSFSSGDPAQRALFDARGAQWASPYGLIGMLDGRAGASGTATRAATLHSSVER